MVLRSNILLLLPNGINVSQIISVVDVDFRLFACFPNIIVLLAISFHSFLCWCTQFTYIFDNECPIFIFELVRSRVFEQSDWDCVIVGHGPWNIAHKWINHIRFPW